MSISKKENYGNDDIASILNTIDSLVSASGMKVEDSKPLRSDKGKSLTPDTIDLNELEKEGFAESQIIQIKKGLDKNLPVNLYADKAFNWMQMYEIRRGLSDSINVGIYANPLYSASQMREIRLGLVDHLDVTPYAKLMLSFTDMQKARREIFAKEYKERPNSFGRIIENDDTGIIIRISDDCMNAYMNVPDTAPSDLTENDLIQVLTDHEITYGFINENLSRIIRDKIHNEEVCVASGSRPSAGKDGYYELFFKNHIENGRIVPPDYEMDYSEVNILDMISPGTLLAEYHPAEKNVDGITVTGITIYGSDGKDLPILSGVGIEYDAEQNIYTATEKGFVSYNSATGSLNVYNVYVIHGDINYFQSFEYDGAVHVTGSVRGASSIKAMGDIIIDGFVEHAYLHSEQNIVIKGGVNSNNQGEIVSGGSIRGKFFENATLKASGLIEGNYFLNCNIFTDDRVLARGNKSMIMGGNIVAALGVESVTIGNYLSKKVLFNVGDTNEIEKRITALSEEYDTVSDELSRLQAGLEKLSKVIGSEYVTKNDLYNKTCAALQIKETQALKLEKEINRLNIVLERAAKAYVHIYGEIQPDVIFCINGVRKKTESSIKRGIVLTKESLTRRKHV